MTADACHRAWYAIHDALPDGWAVGPPSYDPGRGAWTVVARSPLPAGRCRRPDVIEAHGEDEAAALTYLALALEERRGDERRVEIGQRYRRTTRSSSSPVSEPGRYVTDGPRQAW